MNILAIDTATEACSVALLTDDQIHEQFEIAPQQHAKRLLNDIDDLLKSHHVALEEIDVIAFGRGPGSFTGVRIATSAAQALAFAHGLPVAAVSNLEALAWRAYQQHKQTRILAALDARMNEIYWAVYQYDSDSQSMQIEIAEQVSPVSALKQIDGQVCVIGSAWQAYHDAMSDCLLEPTIIENEFPHAYDIAMIAKQQAHNKQLISAEHAMPVYLRDNVAHKKKG